MAPALLVALALASSSSAVPLPPPVPADLTASRPARLEACPLWYHPGEPVGLYPHGIPPAGEPGTALTDASRWTALAEARGWVEVGRPEAALRALEAAPEGPPARLYRLAALEALGRWAELDQALAQTPTSSLPAGCAPLHDLWSARAATARGRPAEADRAFERLAASLPALGGWIDLLRLEAAALVGDLVRGEAAWARIHTSALPGVARTDARRLLPELYARGGRLDSAVDWHVTLAGESRGAERARHWLEATALLDRLGRAARADELRRQAVVQEAAHAGALLLDAALRARLGIEPLETARILIEAGRPAEAEPVATAVLESGAGDESRRRATLLRARGRAARGDRQGAERDYAAFLAQWPEDQRAPDAEFARARLALQTGQSDLARQRFESFFARWPDDSRASFALYLIADSYHDEWDGNAASAERAIRAFDRLVEARPGSSFADRSEMRAAHLVFALGRFAEAERRYRAVRHQDASREARYWTARALARQGRSEEARPIWRELAAGGDDYYALLSRKRLEGGAGLDGLLPAVGYRSAPAPARPALDQSLPTEPAVSVAAALLAVGRRRWARAELDRALAEAKGDRTRLLAWAAALEAWGFPDLALRIGAGLGGSARDTPAPDAETRDARRFAYPAGFAAAIDREAREHALDGAWMMALVRQESMFQAQAVSPAGARGLMQIMPPTGEEIARLEGWTAFDTNVLFHPAVSLHFGAVYVAQQRQHFAGFWPAVLAAYNGGPQNVARWYEFPEKKIDTELWVDRIPFRETREYVRKVVAQSAAYREIYGRESASR